MPSRSGARERIHSALRVSQIVRLEWQRADTFAGRLKHRIAHGRRKRSMQPAMRKHEFLGPAHLCSHLLRDVFLASDRCFRCSGCSQFSTYRNTLRTASHTRFRVSQAHESPMAVG